MWVRVDGIFGPETFKALIKYQKNNGLVVDGVAGPITIASLENKEEVSDTQKMEGENIFGFSGYSIERARNN